MPDAADRPDVQTEARPVQVDRDEGDAQPRRVDERRLREQDRADDRRRLPTVRQEWAERVPRRLVGEIQVVAEVGRQAGRAGEDRQRQPGDDLVRAQRDDEERVDRCHRRSCDGGDADRERQRTGALDAPEPQHRADEHHPLHPEVENAGALGEQLAECGEEQRCAVDHGRRKHDDQHRVVDAAGREDHACASTLCERRANRMR